MSCRMLGITFNVLTIPANDECMIFIQNDVAADTTRLDYPSIDETCRSQIALSSSESGCIVHGCHMGTTQAMRLPSALVLPYIPDHVMWCGYSLGQAVALLQCAVCNACRAIPPPRLSRQGKQARWGSIWPWDLLRQDLGEVAAGLCL